MINSTEANKFAKNAIKNRVADSSPLIKDLMKQVYFAIENRAKEGYFSASFYVKSFEAELGGLNKIISELDLQGFITISTDYQGGGHDLTISWKR